MEKEIDKYYIPDIEEFRMGFEFEQKKYNSKDASIYWEKHIIYSLNWIVGRDWIKDYTRVKYLDKEDIESLGFKYRDRTALAYYYDIKDITLVQYVENIVIVRDNGMGKSSDILFNGKIKNKSELKVLLKQLNIL